MAYVREMSTPPIGPPLLLPFTFKYSLENIPAVDQLGHVPCVGEGQECLQECLHGMSPGELSTGIMFFIRH